MWWARVQKKEEGKEKEREFYFFSVAVPNALLRLSVSLIPHGDPVG